MGSCGIDSAPAASPTATAHSETEKATERMRLILSHRIRSRAQINNMNADSE
jgi:hypothetical protein